MICKSCADAADGVTIRFTYCPVCGRFIQVYRTDLPREQQHLAVHKLVGTRIRCQGSGKAPSPLGGHAACKGCSCQHRKGVDDAK